MEESWYGYPAFASDADWFGNESYYYTTDNPQYYIVEFTSEKTPYKVIYTKEGKKIATSRRLKTELPSAVLNALNKSVYKTWTVSKEREEIFRQSDKKKVYRVVVENGMARHALYFESNGKLIKDKNLN
jgi:mevalonate pyrophosphate decarboxylase